MSWSLLSTTNDDTKTLDTPTNSNQTAIEIQTSEDEEEQQWNELTIAEHNSLLRSLNRVYVYWRQVVLNKVRFLFTLVFVAALNIATRLTHFIRQKTVIQSTPPLSPNVISSSLNRTFEKNLDYSSTSFIQFNSHLDSPSLEPSSMARILVQQQTPNINIRPRTSTEDDDDLSLTTHSLDERMFFCEQDATDILQFLRRFRSESHIPKYQSTTNGFVNKITPVSLNKPEDDEEINSLNCDTIQPVIAEETKIDELDEDILLNASSSLNIERHFRRRKRRSSLTKTSSLNGEIESINTDSIEKVDDNNNTTPQDINEISPPLLFEALPLNDKEESSNQTIPSNRIRGRRSRYRLCRQTAPTSPEPVTDNPVQFFIPTETPVSSPPPSPTSPSSSSNSNPLTGGLKRTAFTGTTKKMVRFADSVGRELAQVQYIQPSIDDDTSNILSGKNNLYLSKTLYAEHKPWSFDVASTSKQISDAPIPRRFFCLYRQPNSEHPDIYLHEIWKSQIKLEHADVRLKSSLTGEQYLYGTLWVTNASYWKNVTIKYSFNRWLNTYEYEARHRCHSNDFRNIDQFEFSIDIPHDVDRIDFVLRYYVNGQEHWDNNEGKNYTIETDSASIPATLISLPHDCDFNEMRFY